MKYGIQNLKEVVDFGFSVGQGLQGALSDGKLSLADLAYALPALQSAGPALQDITKVPKEFADIDMDEAVELVAHTKAKLPMLSDERAREVVAKSLKLALAIGELLHALKKDEDA